METFLIKALQLILSLSILVIVHEFGHFIFARIFKVRVEKFYLFFDPWFSLFKYKPKNSDTEYGVGWLPLGGYCKISGMIDEYGQGGDGPAAQALRVPLQAGRTAFDDYGSGRGVQLLAGFVYLFHDLVYVGRYVLALEEHEDGYEL